MLDVLTDHQFAKRQISAEDRAGIVGLLQGVYPASPLFITDASDDELVALLTRAAVNLPIVSGGAIKPMLSDAVIGSAVNCATVLIKDQYKVYVDALTPFFEMFPTETFAELPDAVKCEIADEVFGILKILYDTQFTAFDHRQSLYPCIRQLMRHPMVTIDKTYYPHWYPGVVTDLQNSLAVFKAVATKERMRRAALAPTLTPYEQFQQLAAPLTPLSFSPSNHATVNRVVEAILATIYGRRWFYRGCMNWSLADKYELLMTLTEDSSHLLMTPDVKDGDRPVWTAEIVTTVEPLLKQLGNMAEIV